MSFTDDMFDDPATVTVVCIDEATGEVTQLPDLPLLPGVPPAAYEGLGAWIAVHVAHLTAGVRELTDAEVADICLKAVLQRMRQSHSDKYFAPDLSRVYAEQAAVALWEFIRDVTNTVERTRRHGAHADADQHRLYAHQEYAEVAAGAAWVRCVAHRNISTKAFEALRILHTDASAADLVKKVVQQLGSVIGSFRHPELVPSAFAMY